MSWFLWVKSLSRLSWVFCFSICLEASIKVLSRAGFSSEAWGPSTLLRSLVAEFIFLQMKSSWWFADALRHAGESDLRDGLSPFSKNRLIRSGPPRIISFNYICKIPSPVPQKVTDTWERHPIIFTGSIPKGKGLDRAGPGLGDFRGHLSILPAARGCSRCLAYLFTCLRC